MQPRPVPPIRFIVPARRKETVFVAEPKARRSASVNRPRPAAGLLLRYTDADGVWYLLGKRHWRLGGTWANVGGSLKPGEEPLDGAVREFAEEVGIPVARLKDARLLAMVDDCGTAARPYTLFVLETPKAFDDAVLSWENTDIAWWHVDHVATLDLHPGFARAWSTLHSINTYAARSY